MQIILKHVNTSTEIIYYLKKLSYSFTVLKFETVQWKTAFDVVY